MRLITTTRCALLVGLTACGYEIGPYGPDDVVIPGTYVLLRTGVTRGVPPITGGSLELRADNSFSLVIVSGVSDPGVEPVQEIRETEDGTWVARESDDPIYLFELNFTFTRFGRFGRTAEGSIQSDDALYSPALYLALDTWTFQREGEWRRQ